MLGTVAQSHMECEVLIWRVPPELYKESGLADDNLARVDADGLLVRDLVACLQSNNEQDLAVALRFAECMGRRPDFCRVAGEKLGTIAALVRKALSGKHESLRLGALGAFVALRHFYPDYAEVMVACFGSPDLKVRYEALARADTYLAGKYFRHLLIFRDDRIVCQGGRWGTDLVYVFRDLALKTAEGVVGRSFECGRKYEIQNGAKVWWRSWGKFEPWLDRLDWRLTQP